MVVDEILEREIKYFAGVGPKKAEIFLKELNITTVEDLIRYYPYRYVDRSKFYKISEIEPDMAFVQVKGEILKFEKNGVGHKQRLTAVFTDGEQRMELIWFQGIAFALKKYRVGVQYVIFGKPSLFNHTINIAHPEIELLNENSKQQGVGLQPMYNTTEKMKRAYVNSKTVQTITRSIAIELMNHPLMEILSADILKRYNFPNLTTALIDIHFPKDAKVLKKAVDRLKFEELFYIQLNILRQANIRDRDYKGFLFPRIGDIFNGFYHNCLPFPLTNAQKRVIKEIRTDVHSGKQMNRLLQGDVGSGKTVVALLAMLIALDNGFQACLMAPTEILATQHFATISQLLGDMNVNVALLTGSTKQKDRVPLFEQLADGRLQIVIGTHALLEDGVKFNNLGFVVIDEQHRFGVAQRAKLRQKSVGLMPHVMVMTATPIPRTLSMTLYGDLDVSVIDELPPGRKPIQTYHYYETKRKDLLGFLAKEIAKGRQVYVVYPLIEESEKFDFQDLMAGYEYFREYFSNYKVSMVHGKMKPNEKEKQMQEFASGESKILVATTVIEVGVNVPNASVMVIESAERFGLSQLHQLRGRVGRGAEQSYCILLTGVKLGKESRQRMEIMTQTNDGFEIAEADLKLRGPGDIEGTVQSGVPFELKISDLAKDGIILNEARTVVREILAQDPTLSKSENRIFANQLQKLKKNSINWGSIS